MNTPSSTLQIRCTALAGGGTTIGEITASSEAELVGRKAFLPFAVPGEVVEAQAVKAEAKFVHAKLLKIVESSAHRITPPCSIFEQCGGCDFQHIEIQFQREEKRRMVESMLARQGGVLPLLGVKLIGSDLPEYGYRARIGLHLEADGKLGFYRQGSGEVVDVANCLISRAEINAALAAIRPFAEVLARFIGGIVIEEHAGKVDIVFKPLPGKVIARDLMERISAAVKFRIYTAGEMSREDDNFPSGHFSQVNPQGNELLIKTVLSHISKMDRAITDLYAGSGNFSIPLAKLGKTVEAVELDHVLVGYGEKLKQEAELHNLTFYALSCESFLKKHNLLSTVVLDPPRSGIKNIIKHFSPKHVRKIVYISCSLPALVRDLKELQKSGYLIRSVEVLDMFAQTQHVECVALVEAQQ